MLNNTDSFISHLERLGLSQEECRIYLALLDKPSTHLALSRKTGVNRTKIYRIADQLAARGLVVMTQDDSGRRLTAASPQNLEIRLTAAEEELQEQREALEQTMPVLQQLYESSGKPSSSQFIVNTYEGADGLKQMLWNELKTKNEILVFGDGDIQDMISDLRWAEKHRAKTVEAGYKVREILNPDGKSEPFTSNETYVQSVRTKRYVDASVLPLHNQICIYNDTIAIYNWHDERKVGLEIINKALATTQRAIFEKYWQLGTSPKS